MRIAITSEGKSLNSPVDPRFGRAAWFIIYDTDTGHFEAHNNEQNTNAVQGAGIQASKTVARLGVRYVLTGHCGPNAFHTLNAAGIQLIVGVEGMVNDAIEQFKRGELSAADRPDVAAHWRPSG